MDTKWKLQEQDTAQGLILDTDSNKQLSEEDISPCDINTDSDKADTIQTDSTQWTGCTQTQPSAPVIHGFAGGA
jgi:hypothetical protein